MFYMLKQRQQAGSDEDLFQSDHLCVQLVILQPKYG